MSGTAFDFGVGNRFVIPELYGCIQELIRGNGLIDVRCCSGRAHFSGEPVPELVDKQMRDITQEHIAVKSQPVSGLIVVHAQIIL